MLLEKLSIYNSFLFKGILIEYGVQDGNLGLKALSFSLTSRKTSDIVKLILTGTVGAAFKTLNPQIPVSFTFLADMPAG